ncbi:AMP-binding protein [Seohaeicola saemankumensis]|nr:AMP-binding protein [Seohaeicola saemankumensis]MCA0873375.1 AMP-binding protein [Seohaeicola saemankumensis]
MNGLTIDEAVAKITREDPRFATGSCRIDSIEYRVFSNAPRSIPELLIDSKHRHDDGTSDYVVFGERRWSYDDFLHDVRRLADGLHRQYGVSNGTRVALAMRNCPEMLVLFMAIASLGGVTAFLNAWWTTEELDYALEDTGATLVFADDARASRLRPLTERRGLIIVGVGDAETNSGYSYSELKNNGNSGFQSVTSIAPDDDFAIMYSSGTTSHPKGVVQTHRGAINAVYTWLMQIEMGPLITPPAPDAPPALRPALLIATPLFHVTASHALFLLSIPLGAKVVLMEKWDAEVASELIEGEQITRFLGVPTQTADLLVAAKRFGRSLSSLEFLGSGGAKRPPAQVAELAREFPEADVATGWGMTETNAIGIGMAGDDYVARPGSAGRLYQPIQELRFLDDDGDDVPPGQVGEITVKSPCNMRTYLNKPKATSEVLQDGWLRTGDLGWIDEDGFITIVDRKKNIVIRGGENIACLDVEAALHTHPAVAEACAFAVPHDRLGEVVGAAVMIREGMTVDPDDLLGFLGAHIARFKIPEQLWIQTAPLARGATDKIDRRVIRAQCLEQISA